MRPVVSSSKNACHVPSSAKGSGAFHKQDVLFGVFEKECFGKILDDNRCPKKADDTDRTEIRNAALIILADAFVERSCAVFSSRDVREKLNQ